MYEIYAKLRDEKGFSDYKVAKLLGFSRTTFVSWRDGTYTPKQDKLQKIADFFGVSLEYLLTGKDTEKSIQKWLDTIMDEELTKVLADYSKLPPEEKQRALDIFRLACKK